jgi:4-amino-4-deoxy-L-arabinose transferase-like glycosyltransferase
MPIDTLMPPPPVAGSTEAGWRPSKPANPEAPTGHGRLWRARRHADAPRWARPGLLVLLIATALAYIYNLSASGFGNTFYAAAVEAGSKSWKAMLFGSLDSSNFITVDKPPGALWIMDLSVRIFGWSTWSVMLPNVLEGVLAVALVYGAVRRVTNHAAGLAAGLVLAVTPVAALMFRFDNPDAFLVLLLTAAAYCLTRALERAGTRWVVAVGALLGFAFLTKMMQAFTVLPAFAAVYLIAAPTNLRRRITQLGAGLAALIVSAGWWLAIVSLVPAADRPMIDGSPTNSIWNLIFAYNGLGRLTGSSGGGGNFSGAAGVFRLFNDLMGGQASWLLPAALIGFVAVLVLRRGTPRTDPVRAAALIWGGWLVVTAAVFSFGRGVIHTYYTVALAPAIAALVVIAAHQLWQAREDLWARAVGAAMVLASAGWAFALLDRTPDWAPYLRWMILAAALAAGAGIVGWSPARLVRNTQVAGWGLAGLVAVAALAGPTAFTANTIRSGHTGSIPSAGPSSGLGGGGAFGGSGGGGRGGAAGRAGLGAGTRAGGPPSGSGSGSTSAERPGGSGDGFPSGTGSRSGPPSGTGVIGGTGATGAPGATSSRGATTEQAGGGGTAGAGGAGGAGTVNSTLVKALESDASHYRWVAAVDGSQEAASLELATTGDPVMAIGGFNGEGGNLSLATFEAYVAKGDIHYFIDTGSGAGGPGGSSSSSAVASWVESHYKSETIGGVTVYDLTSSQS